ncbi:MAG: DUF1385 domain-containing protein [Chloracidobacterium sp.]|nr:DUF1385 domain-containing protein [Chloracidobacterium sp.]
MSQEKEIIVGGQAVIEGVMMRAPNSYAVAVRRQDGSIVSKSERLPKLADKYPILKTPVLRGSVVLIHSMMLGVKALNFSATVAFEDQAGEEAMSQPALQAAAASGALMTTAHVVESPALVERLPQPKNVEKSSKSELNKSEGAATATAAGSIAFALVFNLLIFIALPLLLTNFLFIYFGWGGSPASMGEGVASGAHWYHLAWVWLQAYMMKPVRPSFAFNMVDGVIRMIFFVMIIFSFSRLNDIKRIFEYHGAEHKTVFAWEAGDELTVFNARRHPRQHPRCGTSFLMVVMLVSVALFSVVRFDAMTLNLLARVALIPLIAGVSYEIIRAAGKKESGPIFRLITLPGVWMQNLTTREPSDDQLEVAIYALKESLKLEPEGAVQVTTA